MKDPIKMIENCRKEEIPFIVLKATDKIAQEAFRHYVWYMHSFRNDISDEYKEEIDLLYKEFVDFRMENQYRVDLPQM